MTNWCGIGAAIIAKQSPSQLQNTTQMVIITIWVSFFGIGFHYILCRLFYLGRK